MDAKDLSNLVMRVAHKEDNLEQAAIGFYGYGFVFRDFRHSNDSYVITTRSSRVCLMGAYRDLLKK